MKVGREDSRTFYIRISEPAFFLGSGNGTYRKVMSLRKRLSLNWSGNLAPNYAVLCPEELEWIWSKLLLTPIMCQLERETITLSTKWYFAFISPPLQRPIILVLCLRSQATCYSVQHLGRIDHPELKPRDGKWKCVMLRFLHLVNKTFPLLAPSLCSWCSCSPFRGYQSTLLPELPEGVQSRPHLSQRNPGCTFAPRNAGVVMFKYSACRQKTHHICFRSPCND